MQHHVPSPCPPELIFGEVRLFKGAFFCRGSFFFNSVIEGEEFVRDIFGGHADGIRRSTPSMPG